MNAEAHHHPNAHPPAGHTQNSNARRLLLAFVLTAGFMAVEAVTGWFTGSLALLADAAHMLTDAGSLAMAWAAFYITRRPADPQRSYGYQRFQVLAAFVNGIAMIGLSVWIVIEAGMRIASPVAVMAGPVLLVAVLGLAVNIVSFLILHGGERENLNMRGAALHVIGDIVGSVAAISAALIILYTGWMPADPLLSLLGAGLMLRSALVLVRRSVHVLLEGAPENFDGEAVRTELIRSLTGLQDVHHLHAWSLGDGTTLLTLHAALRPGSDPATLLHQIKGLLRERFGIRHATVQIETQACPDH